MPSQLGGPAEIRFTYLLHRKVVLNSASRMNEGRHAVNLPTAVKRETSQLFRSTMVSRVDSVSLPPKSEISAKV